MNHMYLLKLTVRAVFTAKDSISYQSMNIDGTCATVNTKSKLGFFVDDLVMIEKDVHQKMPRVSNV